MMPLNLDCVGADPGLAAQPMNVLVLSCGAKVQLLRAWREAAARRGGSLTAVDCAKDAVALFEADQSALIPHCAEPDWADAVLSVCQRQRIAVLVPTADAELRAVAELSPRLAEIGVRALVSPAQALALCADKLAFAEFCATRGFPIPSLLNMDSQASPSNTAPLFVRPRFGRRADCTGLVRSAGRLESLLAECPELLVQTAIDAPEYSIDTLLDWDGVPLQAVARRRLRIRGGESCTSRVELIPELTDLALELCQALDLIGHALVQAFWTPDQGANLIEVNARFGGASSLAIAAGLDSPRRLLGLLAGDSDARRACPIRDGLTLLRYGADRLVDDADLKVWPRYSAAQLRSVPADSLGDNRPSLDFDVQGTDAHSG